MVRNSSIALAVLSGGLIVALFVTYAVDGRSVTELTIAKVLGQAIGFSLFPLIVALPWNAQRIEAGRSSRGPISAAIAISIFVLVSVGVDHSVEAEKSAAERAAASTPYEFIGKGCDVSVTFPGRPTITRSPLPGFQVESEQAELPGADGASMFRSECVPLASETLFSERALIGQLELYARNNSLGDPTYSAGHDDRAISGTVLGHKEISSVDITYEVRMLITKKSVVTLTVGGPTATYPQNGLKEFLRSARLLLGQ